MDITCSSSPLKVFRPEPFPELQRYVCLSRVVLCERVLSFVTELFYKTGGLEQPRFHFKTSPDRSAIVKKNELTEIVGSDGS